MEPVHKNLFLHFNFIFSKMINLIAQDGGRELRLLWHHAWLFYATISSTALSAIYCTFASEFLRFLSLFAARTEFHGWHRYLFHRPRGWVHNSRASFFTYGADVLTTRRFASTILENWSRRLDRFKLNDKHLQPLHRHLTSPPPNPKPLLEAI